MVYTLLRSLYTLHRLTLLPLEVHIGGASMLRRSEVADAIEESPFLGQSLDMGMQPMAAVVLQPGIQHLLNI